MITVGMNYRVLPDKGEIFENACRKVIQAMTGMAGHTESHLYRDVDEAMSYLIVSDWTDRGAFEAFIGSETFARVTDWGKEQILAGRPSHTVYEK